MNNGHLPICAWLGCEAVSTRGKLCQVHRGQHNGNNGVGRTGYKLSADQKAVIARRLRRFENPLDLAKEYGVTINTIRATLKSKP